MITLHDLDTAIAKCQGLADPKPSDAIKLAAFYIIKNEMYGQQDQQSPQPLYSYDTPPANQVGTYIDYQSDTEFAQVISGRKAADVWAVMDELMSVLQATNPKLYKAVIYKIED